MMMTMMIKSVDINYDCLQIQISVELLSYKCETIPYRMVTVVSQKTFKRPAVSVPFPTNTTTTILTISEIFKPPKKITCEPDDTFSRSHMYSHIPISSNSATNG